MTTTKSSSEKTRFFSVYKASLKALLPFAIVALIIFALLISLVYVVGISYADVGSIPADELASFLSNQGFYKYGVYTADEQSSFIMVVVILFALILALVQNAYMHSKKMTDFYHSLPVKRPHLMGANLLASMTALFAPLLGVYLVTMLMQLIPYGRYFMDIPGYFAYIGMDLSCAFVVALVVYLFTTFIAVNVGTVFDAFSLTLVIGMTPMTLYCLCLAIWSSVTYGASIQFGSVLPLSPFTFVFQRYMYNNGAIPWNERAIPYGEIFAVLGAWLVIGAILFAGAVFCYNRRKSEICEQTQTEGVFQTIAKCVGAFCGGALFFGIFYSMQLNLVVSCIAILVGAVVIGVIAEMILSRGVRAIKKNLKWLVGSGALCCLILIGSQFDLIGYVNRVPNPEDVEFVTISSRGRFERLNGDGYRLMWRDNPSGSELRDPASIQLLTDVHRLVVENQPQQALASINYDELARTHPYNGFYLTYRMKNGSTMTRSYDRVFTQASVKLTELDSNPEFITQNHAVFYLGEQDGARLTGVTLYDRIGATPIPHKFSAQDNDRLVAAIRADMLAESYEQIASPSAPAVGYIELNYSYQHPYAGSTRDNGIVIVGESYQNTIALLSEFGLLEQMRTLPEVDKIALAPLSLEFGETNQVTALRPTDGYSLSNALEDPIDGTPFVQLSDKSQIDAILTAGRNQMLTLSDNEIHSSAVLVGCFSGEKYVGAQLVSWDVLPEDLQSQLIEWNNSYDSGYGYPHRYGYEQVALAVEEHPELTDDSSVVSLQEESADVSAPSQKSQAPDVAA